MDILHWIFVGYPNWQREWSWHHPVVSLALPLSLAGSIWLYNKIKNRKHR